MASKKIAGITIELSTDTAKLTKGLDQAAKKFEAVGKSFTKNVTAPIMAIGAASIAAWKQVDEGLDVIITKTGATGDSLASMEESLKNIAKDVPADFTEIGAAIGEVNTRFGLMGDDLEDLSTQFLKFAQLNGVDVTNAVDSAQRTLAAFGLSAESAGEYLDILNKVGKNTGLSVETLSAGLQNNAAAFQEMGLSLEQAATFMGQVELSGADVSTVMGSLSKALKNATKDGKPLNQALSELEDTIKNGSDGVDGLTASYELFGKSGATVYNALQQGTLSFKDLADASLNAGGSVSETFETMLDPADRFQLAMQNLKVVGYEIGSQLLEVLTPAIEKLSEWIQSLLDKWNELSPETQNMIIKIALIAAAIGPVLLLISKIVSVVSTVIALGSKLAGVFSLLTGPIGLIVAAIAAAIAIGVLLYKNWDEIKAKAEEIWTAVKEFFIETWNSIKEFFTETWESIKEFLSNAWDGIKIAAETVWNGIKLYFETVLGFWKDLFTNTWNGIKDTVLGVWDGIKTQADIIWTSIKMFIENPIEAIKYFLSNTWENIKTTATNVWNGIKDAITGPIEAAKSTIEGIIERIKGIFPITLSKIFDGFKLPHISYTMEEGFLGIKYPKFKVDWYKKAYDNAMRFTSPTVLPTSSGYKGFGDGAGAEWVIGEKSLMSMIQNAMRQNTLSPQEIYNAVRQGAADATVNMYVDGRKLTDTVNNANTIMLGNSMRMRGAM